MATALPGEIVVGIEGVVGEDLGIGIGADITGIITDALPGEPHVLLSPKWYADFLVAGHAEQTGWIAGDTIVPTNARESEANFIDNVRRKGVNKAGAGNLCRIGIVGGEEHRSESRRKIAARSLSVESIDPGQISGSPVDFEIFLIGGDEPCLPPLVIVLNQTVRGRRIWRGIELGVCGEILRYRIHNWNLIIQIRSKTILRVIKLDTRGSKS